MNIKSTNLSEILNILGLPTNLKVLKELERDIVGRAYQYDKSDLEIIEDIELLKDIENDNARKVIFACGLLLGMDVGERLANEISDKKFTNYVKNEKEI